VRAVTRRIAAGAAGVLLLSLFLPWYGGTVEEAVRPAGVPEGRYTAVTTVVEPGTGWSYLGYVDIWLALGAVAVVVLVLRVGHRRALLAAAAVALAATALIAFRAVLPGPPPHSVGSLELGMPTSDDAEVTTQRSGPERRYGIFVAFLAATTAAGAAALAARREPRPE